MWSQHWGGEGKRIKNSSLFSVRSQPEIHETLFQMKYICSILIYTSSIYVLSLPKTCKHPYVSNTVKPELAIATIEWWTFPLETCVHSPLKGVQFCDSKRLHPQKTRPKMANIDSRNTCNPGTLHSLQTAQESSISFRYLADQNLPPPLTPTLHPSCLLLSTLLRESPWAFSKFLYSGTSDLLFTWSKNSTCGKVAIYKSQPYLLWCSHR